MSTKPDDELIRLFQQGVHEDIATLDERLAKITTALKLHHLPNTKCVSSALQAIEDARQDLAEIQVVLRSYVP
jgi:hypothetical protein